MQTETELRSVRRLELDERYFQYTSATQEPEMMTSCYPARFLVAVGTEQQCLDCSAAAAVDRTQLLVPNIVKETEREAWNADIPVVA